MEKQSFGRHLRITKKRDYLTVYKQGARSYSEHFTIVACRSEMDTSRLGITVSKKVGNAVERNRIRRLVREFFRLNRSRLSVRQDIVIIANKNIGSLTYQDVCAELESHLIEKSNV